MYIGPVGDYVGRRSPQAPPAYTALQYNYSSTVYTVHAGKMPTLAMIYDNDHQMGQKNKILLLDAQTLV